MSESVILCEGFHDRAFWDGWLTRLGCSSDGFKPGTPGFRAADPWGDPVGHGQFAYYSTSRAFLRVRPCNGKGNILEVARLRLGQRVTKPLSRLVVNVDADITAAGAPTGLTGLRLQDILHQVRQVDPAASMNSDGDVVLDAGATKVSLVRWESLDPANPCLPDEHTLERLVCAAVVAAYPLRADAVQTWLASRPAPPAPTPKEYAWSYMAGWYAEYGCDAFYSNIWRDAAVTSALEDRLRQSGAWRIAEVLAM